MRKKQIHPPMEGGSRPKPSSFLFQFKAGEDVFHASVHHMKDTLGGDLLRKLHPQIQPLRDKADGTLGVKLDGKFKILTFKRITEFIEVILFLKLLLFISI